MSKEVNQYKYNAEFFSKHPEILKDMAEALGKTDPKIVQKIMDKLKFSKARKESQEQIVVFNRQTLIEAVTAVIDDVNKGEIPVPTDHRFKDVKIVIAEV